MAVEGRVGLDVTPAIAGNGTYSFGLRNTASDPVYNSSRKGTNAPQLVVTAYDGKAGTGLQGE